MEWFVLRASGDVVPPEDGSAGGEALRGAIQGLLDVLRTFIAEHEQHEIMHNGAATHPEELLQAHAQAAAMATGLFFAETVVALALLRRKLRDSRLTLENEAAVIVEVDRVVALLVPDFSLQAFWQDGPFAGLVELRAQLWVTLGALLEALDRHVPDRGMATPAAAPPSPPSAVVPPLG